MYMCLGSDGVRTKHDIEVVVQSNILHGESEREEVAPCGCLFRGIVGRREAQSSNCARQIPVDPRAHV